MSAEEQYEIYKQQRLQRQNEQQQFYDARQKQREETTAYYVEKNGKLHTATKTSHICHGCKKTIQIGEQYTLRPVVMAWHVESEFFCLPCTKKRDAVDE